MSYRRDSVYRAVEWLRTENGSRPFAEAFADTWRRWAHVEPSDVTVRVGLINYKPFERARVIADVSFVPGRPGSSAVTLNLFLHVHASEEAARCAYEAARRNELVCCYGPSVFRIEGRSIVGWTLPNAPNLSELRTLLDPESFGTFLSRWRAWPSTERVPPCPTLVRYVPSKRALLTWDDPRSGERIYLKLIDGPQAATAALNLQQVHAHAANGELPFAVPRPVHYSPPLSTMVMSEVAGERFTSLMSKGDPQAFADVGRALAGLHRLPAAPATIWSAEKELRDLRRHMEGVGSALPSLAGRLDAIAGRLEDLLPGSRAAYAPIHGNLFGDQILYDRGSATRPVGIVDWDAWSLGDPHFDLGRLIAHLLYLVRIERQPSEAAAAGCIEALLRSYTAAAGSVVDRRALDWHVAAGLLLRAKISSLRKLRPGWPKHFEATVAEAERVLGGGAAAPWQLGHGARPVRQVERASA